MKLHVFSTIAIMAICLNSNCQSGKLYFSDGSTQEYTKFINIDGTQYWNPRTRNPRQYIIEDGDLNVLLGENWQHIPLNTIKSIEITEFERAANKDHGFWKVYLEIILKSGEKVYQDKPTQILNSVEVKLVDELSDRLINAKYSYKQQIWVKKIEFN